MLKERNLQTNVKVEINEIENRKTGKVNETGFFKKIKKIVEPLARLLKKKRFKIINKNEDGTLLPILVK